jgi:hypothetical protein
MLRFSCTYVRHAYMRTGFYVFPCTSEAGMLNLYVINIPKCKTLSNGALGFPVIYAEAGG